MSTGAGLRPAWTGRGGDLIYRAMRDTPFIKMHGLGNDFVVIDARAVHLAAHLETKEVLSAAQIARYNALRGYRLTDTAPHDHSMKNHGG
jgi:hypothetical protein